jgi:hypothetical protein
MEPMEEFLATGDAPGKQGPQSIQSIEDHGKVVANALEALRTLLQRQPV